MEINSCIKKIEKYLTSSEFQPIFVNVNNCKDFLNIKQHFCVGEYNFIQISNYCKKDESPNVSDVLNTLSKNTGICFLTGLSSFLKFKGERELKVQLATLIAQTFVCKVVVICFQCEDYIRFEDPRLSRRIFSVDGLKTQKPKIFFVSKNLKPLKVNMLGSFKEIFDIIETKEDECIYVCTSKKKQNYPYSLFSISDMNQSFDILKTSDCNTQLLEKAFGTQEQWDFALEKMLKFSSWTNIVINEFGNTFNLEFFISNWFDFDENKKWLYFISLKLFGAKNNDYLNYAIKTVTNVNGVLVALFNSLLNIEPQDEKFWQYYNQRKILLSAFDKEIDAVLEYCNIVFSKEKQSIYYLTDNTKLEKETMITCICKYRDAYSADEMYLILEHTYPDLYAYLSDYKFNEELFNVYFQTYKYEKLTNRIYPEFEKIVNEQAVKREYNLLLPHRTEVLDAMDKENSEVYFVDALGVEFVAYITEKCHQKGLTAITSVCRAELPTITSCNKEFIETFQNAGIQVSDIKKLDDIKHHGKEDFDYRKTQLPIHLIRELEIIDELLDKIKVKLVNKTFEKAIIISDHGASRLAVINENTLNIDVNSKGTNGGRVCGYNEKVAVLKQATQVEDYYVLANYDLFKGGRAASVETHGGATLEEVVIPIIELTYQTINIDVIILTPVIKVSYKHKASIKLFSNSLLKQVTVLVDNEYYDAVQIDDKIFKVDMPKLKRAKKYDVKVYESNNLIANNLSFTIEKEGVNEKDLL